MATNNQPSNPANLQSPVTPANPTTTAPGTTSGGAAGASQFTTIQAQATAGGGGTSNLTAAVNALRTGLQSGGAFDSTATAAGIRGMQVTTSDDPYDYMGRNAGPQKTVGQLLDDLQTMSTPELEALQSRLIAAGYAGKDGLDLGNKFDVRTRQAYGALLADGLAYPTTPLDQIIQQKVSDVAARGGAFSVLNGGIDRIQLTDPNKIRDDADQVGQAVLGRNMTEAEKARYVSYVHGKESTNQGLVNAASDAQQAKTFGLTSPNGVTVNPDGSTAGGFEGFVQSIIKHESGNPKAIGLTTNLGTATGKYQVLDSTWANYGGYARASDAPEAVQDQFARQRLQAMYDQFGAAGAAVAWYAGSGVAAQYVKDPTNPKWQVKQSAGGKSGNMPSIAEYAANVAGDAGASATPAGVGGQAAYLAPTPVTDETVDPQADLKAQVRADHPVEAQAHDLGTQWTAFQAIVGAPRGGV